MQSKTRREWWDIKKKKKEKKSICCVFFERGLSQIPFPIDKNDYMVKSVIYISQAFCFCHCHR